VIHDIDPKNLDVRGNRQASMGRMPLDLEDLRPAEQPSIMPKSYRLIVHWFQFGMGAVGKCALRRFPEKAPPKPAEWGQLTANLRFATAFHPF
jgi:hypothetical protein